MFKIETNLNQYLPTGANKVDVIFSVSTEGELPVQKANQVIGFVGDISGSMSGQKIDALRNSLRLSVDLLTQDQQFFIIVFNHEPHVIVERCYATTENKRKAHASIQKLSDGGGTCMSRALAAARQAFKGADGVSSIYMLTDGENDDSDERNLREEIKSCAGIFQAHCRGVGTQWSPNQLRQIANGLVGTLDMVAKPEKLKDDFESTLKLMSSKGISDVRLQLRSPKSCQVTKFKQAFPSEIDLFNKAKKVGENIIEFPLGAFGVDTQDYLVNFQITPGNPGDRVMVCKPSLVYANPVTKQDVEVSAENVVVVFTDDASLTARINKSVANYTGQAEKAIAIQEGLEALAKKDVDVATVKLGRALKLATDVGDQGTIKILKKVVDVIDEETGTIRIKRSTSAEDVMQLDVASTRTVRVSR